MHEIRFICSFFSAARRTNQEAPPRLSGFWLVATVAVGVCGTRFARIVLALFPPSSLRLHRPIKAESGDLACILTPSPCGHSPYIPCRNTGEKGNTRFGNEVEFYCFVTPRHVTGHGRGRRLNTNDFLSPPKIVSDARDALRLFILLSSEKNEPRSAAAVIGLLARRYGRRRGLRNSLRSDSPRPFSSVFLATSPPDKGGDFARAFAGLFNPLALWALPLYSL